MILTSDCRLQLFGLVGGSKTFVNTNASFHANTLSCFKIDDPWIALPRAAAGLSWNQKCAFGFSEQPWAHMESRVTA